MHREFVFALICHSVIRRSFQAEPTRFNENPTYQIRAENEATRLSYGQMDPRNSKIIGGQPTIIGHYPYLVSLQRNGTFLGHDVEHFCVGNIVGEKWILTAAKCCYGEEPSQFHVRVGSELYYVGGHIHEIESIKIHPYYTEVTWDYDIGLLKLRKTIIFDENAQPIKLPEVGRGIDSGAVLDIAGWGSIKLLGMPSEQLVGGSVLTISQNDCIAVYGRYSVTDRMFCVFEMGKGPCIGDTGSPAILNGVIVGVASWSQSCAYNYPTAYARLPEMVDWIIKVTGDSSSEAGNHSTN